MTEKKKRKPGKKPKLVASDNTPQKALSTLGEVLIDTLNEKDPTILEVFERYTHILQFKIQTRTQDFPDRLCKGYQLLCDELKTSNK